MVTLKIHSSTIASIISFRYYICAFEENLKIIFKIIFLG